MVGTTRDFPDFTHGILLLGVDGLGNQVGVLLDSTGQLFAILRGTDGSGDLQNVRVDGDGQLYVVLQGASGNAVAVDSDGFISAVLKGIRDDVLTTIAVDINGRIEAFTLDSESQWGDFIRIGSGEMAARLGSTKAYDWRGNVLVSNNFENGNGGCQLLGGGADYSITVDPEYSVHGGYSLKMLGSSTGDFSAKAQWVLGKNPSQNLGLEVCWSTAGLCDYVDFAILVRGAGNRYNCRFRVDPGSWLFKYQDSDGNFQTIANTFPPWFPYAFNYMKIVGDFDTGLYERFLLNGVEYDLSAYSMQSEATGFLHSIEIQIEVISTSGSTRGIRLDYFTITLDEPANK